MTKSLLLFCVNCLLLFKISHAQCNRYGPNAPPTPNTKAPTAPTPAPTNAPIFEQIAPKCYPETATAYFLPAPPCKPKITVLNPNSKELSPNLKLNVRDATLNKKEKKSSSLPSAPPSKMTSSVTFPPPPPPPCLTGLADLINEIPTTIQDRLSRLAEPKEKPTVCETCARLLKKLPIFNFDQELLDGFLAGIGL